MASTANHTRIGRELMAETQETQEQAQQTTHECDGCGRWH